VNGGVVRDRKVGRMILEQMAMDLIQRGERLCIQKSM